MKQLLPTMASQLGLGVRNGKSRLLAFCRPKPNCAGRLWEKLYRGKTHSRGGIGPRLAQI